MKDFFMKDFAVYPVAQISLKNAWCFISAKFYRENAIYRTGTYVNIFITHNGSI